MIKNVNWWEIRILIAIHDMLQYIMQEIPQLNEPHLYQVNQDKIVKIGKILGSGPDTTQNNKYEQYYKSMAEKHETAHDWLRYYLNLLSDEIDPGRLLYKPTAPHEKEVVGKCAGLIPMSSPSYYLMLNDFGLLPHNYEGNSDNTNLGMINSALTKLFTGKTVYFLPGRSGSDARVAIEHGANVGFTTDERYIGIAQAALQQYSLKDGIIAFAENCRIENALSRIRSNHHAIVPNIVISTNMFNEKRFDNPSSPHHISLKWQELLLHILSVGSPEKTRFYITPAVDYQPAFTRDDLLEKFGDIADINFYDPENNGGPSVAASTADFAFSMRLKGPIAADHLNVQQ
jgi:hypothetical protein